MAEDQPVSGPKRSRFGNPWVWFGVVVVLTILLPPLIGTEIPMGRTTVAAYSDPNSPQEKGFTHFKDPGSEGWLLRIGSFHWVFGLTR